MPAAPSSTPTSCCSPGPEDLAIWQWFATSSMPREDHAAAVLVGDGRRQGLVGGPAGDGGRRPPVPAGAAAQGARRRRRGGAGAGRLAVDRPAVGLRRRPVRPRHAHARGRAAGDDRLRPAGRRGRVPDVLPAARRSTTRPRRPAAGATSAPAPGTPPTCPEAAAEAASAALDRPGVELAPRAQWPTGADRLGVDVKGKIAPADQLETGRAVARLTDLGWGQRLRTLLGDDGVGGVVTLDLEAPGIEEDPDAAFDVPGAALGLRRASGRRAAQGVRARARRPGTGRSGPARSSRCRRAAVRSW